MIVAHIGSQTYALESLADANTILEILGRAKVVDDGYITKDYDTAYYERSNGSRGADVAIKIVRAELLTKEQFDELRARNGVTA